LLKVKCLPARKAQQLARLEELLGKSDKVLIDATERLVERPQDQDEQKGKLKKTAYGKEYGDCHCFPVHSVSG
jgi:hypothetical protein